MPSLRRMTPEEAKENFATPLAGQFLNLPNKSVEMTCIACHATGMSELRSDEKWYANGVNMLLGCWHLACCCCLCRKERPVCKDIDRNHYCSNCGCYFGRNLNEKRVLKK